MKSYNINTHYNYDAINNSLTVSSEFLKRAGKLGSPEFQMIQKYRQTCPGIEITEGVIVKKSKSYVKKHFTYEEMENFFKTYYAANNSENRKEFAEIQDEFKKVKTLSALAKSPYKVVSKWFEEKTSPMREELEMLNNDFNKGEE